MLNFLLSKPKAPDAGDIVRLRSGSLIGPIEYVGDTDGDGALFRACNEDGDVLEWDDEGYATSKIRAHDIVQTSASTRECVGNGDILVYGSERWKVTRADWLCREILTSRIHPQPGTQRYVGCFGSFYTHGNLVSPDAIISNTAWLDLEPVKPAEPVETVVVVTPDSQHPVSVKESPDQIEAPLDFGTPPEQFADGMPVDGRYTLEIELPDALHTCTNLPGTMVKDLRASLRDTIHGIDSFFTILHEGKEVTIRGSRICGYTLEKEP